VLRDLAPERATPTAPADQPPVTGLVVAAAAVRGAVVALAGVLLTAGLALMVWAVTPASGPDAAVALRGGVTAFALANLMPVSVGGVVLSLPPLLLTAVPVLMMVVTARRGRFLPVGRYQEALAVLTTAGVYGLVVAATTRGYSSSDAVPAGWVWTAFVLALVATGAGMLRGDSAWSRWAVAALPGWIRVAIRGGLVGSVALVGVGALVLSCGLILRFGTAVDIAAATAPSWLDGIGVTLLGLAYLPNAVVAAIGYLSGVGFEIGPGTYSPLATSTVDLPGVPLLAAAPQHDGRTALGLTCLAVPLLVGYLMSRPGNRRLVTRADRVAAATLGAVITGAVLALAALVAGGGVGDGRWATMGVNAALLGPVIALGVGVSAVMIAAVTGGRSVPWRIRDVAAERAEPAPTSRRRARRPRGRPANATAENPTERESTKATRVRRRRRARTATTEAAKPGTADVPDPPGQDASDGDSTDVQSADGATDESTTDESTTDESTTDESTTDPAGTGDDSDADADGDRSDEDPAISG